MGKPDKTKARILSGRHDRNIRFDNVVSLLLSIGLTYRIRGSHHIFTRKGVPGKLNLQPKKDGACKPFQIKQVRQYLESLEK